MPDAMDMRLLFLARPLDPKTRRSLYERDVAPRVPWISDNFAGIGRSDVATGRSEPPVHVAGRSTERPRATVETQKVSCIPNLTMRAGKIPPGIRNAEPVRDPVVAPYVPVYARMGLAFKAL